MGKSSRDTLYYIIMFFFNFSQQELLRILNIDLSNASTRLSRFTFTPSVIEVENLSFILTTYDANTHK